MTSVATRRGEQDDSGEYSDASQDIEQNNSGNDGGQPESDYDSRGSDSDHSDREDENQEGQTERRVDDDEDRSNPQYIPKRGTFYEHDDRTAAVGEESTNVASDTASEKKEGSETPLERRRPPRKSETNNKWSHDKYNENEQMPKSRDELVAIYGYDIRNEDAPPHARRNRRYGRGPNKYTRTWEDEEAYKRQTAVAAQSRKPPNPEDFPELDAKFTKRTRARPRSKSQPSQASNDSSESGTQLRRNASIKTPKGRPAKQTLSRPVASKPSPKPAPAKDKMPPLENLTITASVFNNSHGGQRKVSSGPVAQQRPVPTEQGRRRPPPSHPPQPHPAQAAQAAPPAPPTQHTQTQPAPAPAPSKPQQQQQGPPQQQQQQPQQKTQQNQQGQQAPAGTEPRGGSKRYSSLRQRPLAETYSPQQPQQQKPQQQQQQQQQQQPQQQSQPPQQQQHRYHADYVAGGQPPPQHQGSPVPQMHPQQMIHQVHRTAAVNQPPHGPSPPHQHPPQHPPQHPIPPVLDHTQQQVRLGILEQQQMVSHPHHAMHQPHQIGQLQPAQGYAPPAIMPAQYMQQQSSSGAVYGGAMFQPPAAYPHQIYPHPHNYQATQAGGVTYFSCAEQEQQPRAQRRPTAAIPIVRPAAPDRAANSTEKDNIDRIVENMFVRKPWPASHGGDSKDKPADPNRGSQEPPSKESSQPNSLTSSSMSTDSKPSEPREEEKEPTGAPANPAAPGPQEAPRPQETDEQQEAPTSA